MDKKTVPLTQEVIDSADTLMAKCLLVLALVEIDEFTMLWSRAKQIPDVIIKTIRPKLEEISTSLSPAGRGALLAASVEVTGLYDEHTEAEALLAATKLKRLGEAVNEFCQNKGITPDYLPILKLLVEPLGVPDLAEVIMAYDIKEWGIDRILAGPIDGLAHDLLASRIIHDLTDLSLADAFSETRTQFNQRVMHKVGPLARHVKKYALLQRIQLWVRNVVYGESIRQIAESMVPNVGYSSDDWVKQQIQDASRILGVKRLTGRPRKGGVIRDWKLMAK
jgi:hypothetical protein